MSPAASRWLLLTLALPFFIVQLKAVGICDYDVRTYTNQTGAVQFTTVRSGKYRSGHIGEVPFSSRWYSKDTCNLDGVSFKCVYADDGGISRTNITLPNITNVDTIYLDSTYPVTLHRTEDHVMDKSRKDRFIVEKDMHLTKCPKYRQTRLVWQFPGNLTSRSAFECFREKRLMCRGVSMTKQQGKCLVKEAGDNLMHIRDVNASKSDVEFFYCRLDPATPHVAMTYNVDWRASQEVPPEGLPGKKVTETPAPIVEPVVDDKVTPAIKPVMPVIENQRVRPPTPPPNVINPKMVAVNTTSVGKQITASGLGFLIGLYAVLAN